MKLPELLFWHRRDFISDPQYSSTDFKSVNEDLVSFIVSQLDGEKEREMKELLSLDRVHEFAENISKFMKISQRKDYPLILENSKTYDLNSLHIRDRLLDLKHFIFSKVPIIL